MRAFITEATPRKASGSGEEVAIAMLPLT